MDDDYAVLAAGEAELRYAEHAVSGTPYIVGVTEADIKEWLESSFVAGALWAREDLSTQIEELERVVDAENTHKDGGECKVCDHMHALDVGEVYDQNLKLTDRMDQVVQALQMDARSGVILAAISGIMNEDG